MYLRIYKSNYANHTNSFIQQNHRSFYEADTDEKQQGILFLPDLTGVQKTTHKSAEILSKEGNYNVLIPNLYSGGTNLQKYCVQFLMNNIVRNNEPDNNAPLPNFLKF